MYNSVTLIGNIGQTPDIYQGKDHQVANFRLATTKIWTDDHGQVQTSTEWHPCALWRRDLSHFTERVGVGTLLFVQGELTHRDEDKEGVHRRWTEVRVRTYRVLDGSRAATPDASTPGDEPPTEPLAPAMKEPG